MRRGRENRGEQERMVEREGQCFKETDKRSQNEEGIRRKGSGVEEEGNADKMK